jgi:hypothetical protein
MALFMKSITLLPEIHSNKALLTSDVGRVVSHKERKMQQSEYLVFNRPRLKSGLTAKVHSSGLATFLSLYEITLPH